MPELEQEPDEQLLATPVAVPEHVVSRSFEGELVVLNLKSGEYHGLNPVGARIFEGLRGAGTGGALVDGLASEYEQPREVIQRDVAGLLRSLAERGLVVIGEIGG